MARNTVLAPGEYYHVYNRGTDKRKIFTNKHDHERFLALMYMANGDNRVHLQLQGSTLKEVYKIDRGELLVEICAYCLMPNHFHLLIKEVREGGTSLFMQKLTTGYTMYFNKRYDRTGSLFQGRFKAVHVGADDQYLKYLIAYIHLNPIKLVEPTWKEDGIKNMGLVEKYLDNYFYSSYLDYAGEKRAEEVVITRQSLPQYFDSPLDFKSWVSNWMSYSEAEFPSQDPLRPQAQARTRPAKLQG